MTHSAGTLPDEILRIRDIELRFRGGRHRPPPSTDGVIYVHKDAKFVRSIDETLQRVCPKRMIEVGILDGGSTVYWHHQYDLERLAAFEIEAEAPCLTRYLERNKLTDAVRPRPNAKLSPIERLKLSRQATNERYHVRSSSKALACFKSRVSKPSVNQP